MRLRYLPYILAFAAAVFAAAGCAGKSVYKPDGFTPGGDAVIIEGVPAFLQEKNRCGPAAMASMLCWSGIDTAPQDLEEKIYDPSVSGSLQISLIAAARRHGRVAYEIQGLKELQAEIKAGHPVLVLMNKGLSWWPVWHYAVVGGFDFASKTIILAGGKGYKEYMLQAAFQRMWNRGDNWGLLVLSPGDIPATATKKRWIEAIYALERAGRHAEALAGYRGALEKWPEDLGAMMGKANALYALGNLEDAMQVLERASEIYTESGPVFNNLACVLLELEKLDEAMEAAVKAVNIGGPHLPAYKETLKNIKEAALSEARIE